jgi:hypothetical protein
MTSPLLHPSQTRTDRWARTATVRPDDTAAPTPSPAERVGPVYARIAVNALAVAGATAVGLRWAARPPAVRTITMGPGGWVSFKGAKPPPLGPRRPWWAVLLRALPRSDSG